VPGNPPGLQFAGFAQFAPTGCFSTARPLEQATPKMRQIENAKTQRERVVERGKNMIGKPCPLGLHIGKPI
jgi:hypothetical protein